MSATTWYVIMREFRAMIEADHVLCLGDIKRNHATVQLQFRFSLRKPRAEGKDTVIGARGSIRTTPWP